MTGEQMMVEINFAKQALNNVRVEGSDTFDTDKFECEQFVLRCEASAAGWYG